MPKLKYDNKTRSKQIRFHLEEIIGCLSFVQF